MFRRHVRPPEHEPLVTDPRGRVVGIRTAPARLPEESPASRLWHRRNNLAQTGEMRAQAALRNQFAAFHIDPASSPKR